MYRSPFLPAEGNARSLSARPRRWRWWWVLLLAGLALGGLAPSLVARSPLRHRVVTRILAQDELRATVQQATWNWWSPVVVSGLRIDRVDGQLQIRVAEVRCRKTLFQLLVGLPDIGEVEILRPDIAATFTPGTPWWEKTPEEVEGSRSSRDRIRPTWDATVRQLAVSVRNRDDPEPVLALREVNVSARMTSDNNRSWLIIDPTFVFDRQRLSPQLCNQGLQLVAPILADAASVTGGVSLALEQCELPLRGPGEDSQEAVPAQARIRGTVTLHEVSAQWRGPILLALSDLLSALADTEAPRTLRMVEDCQVQFQFANGLVEHQGLAFLLPEISPELKLGTRGTVSLGGEVDLAVNVQLPASRLKERPILARLAGQPLELRIQGTLEQPKVGLPEGHNLLEEFARRVLGDGDAPTTDSKATTDRKAETADQSPAETSATQPNHGELAPAILDVVGEAVEQLRKANPDSATPVLDLLRQRRRKSEGTEPEALPPAEPQTSSRPGPIRGRLRGLGK